MLPLCSKASDHPPPHTHTHTHTDVIPAGPPSITGTNNSPPGITSCPLKQLPQPSPAPSACLAQAST